MDKTATHYLTERLEALAAITDEPGRLTRTFCSPAMKRANALVGQWMREAGMEVREDAIGNLRGSYPAAAPAARTLVLGSHLDTVRDAGRFDGALGVLAAIACVQALADRKARMPFAIEVIGFCDEEGVRYQTTYLGSKAVAGKLELADLQRKDADGVTIEQALHAFGCDPNELQTARLNPEQLLGYVEVHIEQGPVLEQRGLALGLVSAIAGQTRAQLTFSGRAGHAGTTPMNLRRDALCGAAEFILATERLARSRDELVATVGQLEARPGASNVIPAEARLTLDLRHADDEVRARAIGELEIVARQLAAKRSLELSWDIVQTSDAVACDEHLSAVLAESVRHCQGTAPRLGSGAGHDAAVMAAITPVAMLFVRCKDGLSHHPLEFAAPEDIGLAVDALSDFVSSLAQAV